MTKTEAKKKHKEIKEKISALIQEAIEVSEASGVEFEYEPQNIGTYYPTGSEDHPYADWDDEEDDVEREGEWYPSSWNSSSIYC
jgi:hypothetical protein